MARLVVTRGPGSGRSYELPAYPAVIGREAGCEFVVEDPRASRQHACVRLREGRYEVRDLDTPNGTFVGNERISGWTPLAHGTTLRLGHSVLRFEDPPPPRATAPTPTPAAAPSAAARAAASPSAAAPAAAAPVATPVSGTAFPRVPGHDVLEQVGAGAGGTVYRARQRTLERDVALKVLAPALAQRPRFVERFVAEARAAAALSHPHVVPVYDVGESDGVHWFTMEFMAGGTVEQVLADAPDGRLPWRDAVALASAAARGLAYLHEQGFVHRDVKPANLLLDPTGLVKLGDMGTLTRADDADAARIGTPHYMSPEQARGEPVTRASDVYSLGATLYRMLAGRTPHADGDGRAVLRAVASERPPDLARFAPRVPAEVLDAVAEMMAPDAAARPTDAGAVGERLAAALVDVHVSRTEGRRARRLRRGLSEVLIRFLAILVGVAGLVWFLWRQQLTK